MSKKSGLTLITRLYHVPVSAHRMMTMMEQDLATGITMMMVSGMMTTTTTTLEVVAAGALEIGVQ